MLSKLIPYLPIQSRIVTNLYKRFCDDEESINTTIKSFREKKIGTILDYAVEQSKFDSKKSANIIVRSTSLLNSDTVAPDFIAIKASSLNLSEMEHIIKNSSVPVLVDAENYDVQKYTHGIVRDFQLEYNTQYDCKVYNTYQSYLKHTYQLLKDDIKLFRDKKRSLGIKLVRGAYLEHERKHNPDILCDNFHRTNMQYNRALLMLLTHKDTHPHISTILATHNRDSINIAMRNASNLSTNKLAFAQLKGIRDDLTDNILENGFQAYKYVPYGPRKDVIPYIVRRAQENKFVLRSLLFNLHH